MECLPVKKIEFDDEAHLKKYITWENKSNICWLDSSMALVAHNKVMKKYSGVSPQCCISKIISAYDDAISTVNGSEKTMDQKLNLARGRLNYVQESTLEYLQPRLKYVPGDPESAFCSLYNLLIQDPIIKKIFDVTWLSVKECTDCDHQSESTKSKPIITLSKIDSFDPENLTVVYRCSCNKSEQKIKLIYVSLPPCLIFHFENGAGNEKPPLSFITRGREYHLTGIMTLEKSQDSTVNHFITWVRDPSVDKWLDCNDLNLDIIYFSPDFPDINIKDVYMYMYEAFDDLGTITDAKIIKAKKSEENIPCFDLSEESDIEISDSQMSATESNKDTGKMKTLKPDLKSSSAKLDSNTSLGRSLSTDKSTVEKNIQHADFTEHMKNISNMVNVNINESQIKSKEVDEDKIHGKNVKTGKNKILKTPSITPGSNLTSTDGNSTKEVNKSICKSDFSAYDKITEKVNENSCLFPSPKTTSHSLEDRHDDFVVKDKISAESEPSFDNEKKKKSVNTTKNIQNEELLSKAVYSNTSDIAIPKSLKKLRIKDLIKIKCVDKTNVEKDDMNNSEQLFTISNAKQRHNDRLVLNSNVQQEKLGGHFLSDAGASSSGTSYVKLSVRRKKISSDPLYRTNSENDTENSDLSEAVHNMADATPSTSTSVKRNRVAEDCDYVPLSEKSKKKKLSNVENDSVSPKKRAHGEDLKNTKKKSRVKSELSNTSKRTVNDNSGLDAVKKEDSNDPRSLLSDTGFEAGAAENLNLNSGSDIKILRDFGDIWSCHETGCNCESASIEEVVDSGVDFFFSYFCRLSQEFDKCSKQ